MRLLLNGEWTEAPEGESLQALLGRLGIDPRRVAVERNLAIVPKDRYAGTVLGEGDRLEIVHFVGGG
jgi:thiazole synthase